MATSNESLLIKVEQLKNLERMAGETVSPFAKARLAEKAVSVAVEIISELVSREVSRG